MKLAILRDRADMLAKARRFFSDLCVLEVDVPLLCQGASIDAHIDLIPAEPCDGKRRYLHSSPEYGIKRLLAAGMGDCYQLAHVFRDEECGERHNPEFMMAEWYRLNISFETMIRETVDFVKLFIGDHPYKTITYREAYKQYAGVDYVHASNEELLKAVKATGTIPYKSLLTDGKNDLLNMLMIFAIEPALKKEGLCVLSHYPAGQAALARKIRIGDEEAAERFEVYYRGLELANGYHELSDAKEQRIRFVESNQERTRLGKEQLPIDEPFLKALDKLPECCGVAVGFDRLMMLRSNSTHINDVIPFGWATA